MLTLLSINGHIAANAIILSIGVNITGDFFQFCIYVLIGIGHDDHAHSHGGSQSQLFQGEC